MPTKTYTHGSETLTSKWIYRWDEINGVWKFGIPSKAYRQAIFRLDGIPANAVITSATIRAQVSKPNGGVHSMAGSGAGTVTLGVENVRPGGTIAVALSYYIKTPYHPAGETEERGTATAYCTFGQMTLTVDWEYPERPEPGPERTPGRQSTLLRRFPAGTESLTGNGNILRPSSAEITEEDNATFEIVMDLPLIDQYRVVQSRDLISSPAPARKILQNGQVAIQSSDQTFRVYDIKEDTEKSLYSIRANHVFYDLLKAVYMDEDPEDVDIRTALSMLLDGADHETGFTIETDCTGNITAAWKGKNLCEILLDPENGLCAQMDAHLTRDNWHLYLISNIQRDNGVRIEHSRNLIGATIKKASESACNRIIAKIDDEYTIVDDPLRGENDDIMAVVRNYDKENGTAQEQAEKEFAQGIAGEALSLEVNYVLLSEKAGSQYQGMQQTLIGDKIHLKLPYALYEADLNGVRWNPMTRMYNGVTVGMTECKELKNSVPGFAIGGVKTMKLIGTVTGSQIADGSITTRHLTADSVTAEQIVAGAVKAEQIDAGSVTAQKLSASSVTTEKLAASAVTADKLAASAVTADHIAADAVEAHHLSADALSAIDAEIGSANIGYAQIKDASVQNLITKDAIADRYYIQKLMVQNLQVIEQTVQNLVVKASNGNYYRLDVNENTGAVTPTQVTVTAGEISAGVTTSGRSIIDTDILAADLSATNIKGANALIDRITASRLDVGELFARQAFISQLNTTDIRSNTYLQTYVGQQIDLSVGPIAIGNINWFENSDGYDEVTGPSPNTSFQFAFGDIAKHWNLFRGKQITVSFDIELENATGNGTGVFIEPQFWFSDSSYQSFQIVYTLNSTPKTLSARAAKTFTVQDKALDHVAQSGIYIYGLTGGRVKVGRPKLEIGSKATEWTLAPTELKNTSVNINRQGIYMNTGGIIDMKAGTAVNISGADGMIDIRGNGTIGATSGNFTDLMVGGKQIGVTDFLMPVPCKFTQGQSSAPAGHGFLWLNASGSSYSQASAQGAPAVGYLPQTFNISAPTNVLSSGTFDYSLTFAVTHRQASTPGSITVNVAVKITNPTTGANLTFNFGSVTLRLWQSVTRTITITGSSINLMGANAALRAECSRTAGTVLTYLDSNVNLVLTATKQNAGGAQSVTMQYVP